MSSFRLVTCTDAGNKWDFGEKPPQTQSMAKMEIKAVHIGVLPWVRWRLVDSGITVPLNCLWLGKFICQFKQIHFKIYGNTFCNFEKYILQYGQIWTVQSNEGMLWLVASVTPLLNCLWLEQYAAGQQTLDSSSSTFVIFHIGKHRYKSIQRTKKDWQFRRCLSANNTCVRTVGQEGI